MSRLCLIDAHSLCYRAFFAIKANLTTSFGQPTNAVYGFVNMLNRILKEIQPEYVAICFDTAKPTFREEKFKAYKIQRPPMPDDLRSQIPIIREIIQAYNIAIVEKDGFEADDIIATLAHLGIKQKLDVVVVTSDKDMLQLVDEHIQVYNPYKDDGVFFGREQVKEKFGVQPEHMVDLLALMGDSVDNIPGVKGIGEKTARQLMNEFGDTDSLLRNVEKVGSDKLRGLIKENSAMIRLSKELAQLSSDCDVNFRLNDAKHKEYDVKKLYELFARLEFKTFLKHVGAQLSDSGAPQEFDFLGGIEVSRDREALKKELAQTRCFAFSFLEDEKKPAVALYPGKNTVYELWDQKEIAFLFQSDCTKIGGDLKSAKHRLSKDGACIHDAIFDIAIAAYLIDPARTDYSLEALAYDYLKIGPLSQGSVPAIKRPVLIQRLKEVLEKELRDRKLDTLFYTLELPLIEVLFRMEENGFALDTQFLAGFSVTLEKKLKSLIRAIFDSAQAEFNINSPKQLREVLFGTLKLPVIKKTKTGPSTDEEVLRKLASRHELPSLILEYRGLIKLKTTYVDVLPELVDKKTQRIHSNFIQTGTETGRLSSNNPNLQNIPIKTELGRQIRRAFIAGSAQSLLLSSDYSQIELRILAHLSGDEALAAAFGKGADIHRATAALIYQLKEEDVQDEMRAIAKRVNFGVIYGMSAFGLSKDLDISLDVAQDFIDTYFVRYAKVKEYIERQIATAKDKGYVATVLGRRRYLPHINAKNMGLRQFSERQAVNASIQGSAADLIKIAMVRIQAALDKEKMRSKMVAQVHDELVFDFPRTEQTELIDIVKTNMEKAIALDVPVKVSLSVGKNWADLEAIE